MARPFLAHCRDNARRPWRQPTEALRATTIHGCDRQFIDLEIAQRLTL